MMEKKAERGRFSSQRKMAAVLRLLRGAVSCTALDFLDS